MERDTFHTLEGPTEASLRERSSKFLAFAYPVSDEEEIAERIGALRRKYYDATHHCYAWRLGPQGERYRSNDDQEPSGTAGRPILGQLLSREVTDALVVVVRYFGGTKLGTAGLIAAYREAASEALDAARIVERTVDVHLRMEFPYEALNEVMRVVKDEQPRIEEQRFDNRCTLRLAIRSSRAEGLAGKLNKIGGATLETE